MVQFVTLVVWTHIRQPAESAIMRMVTAIQEQVQIALHILVVSVGMAPARPAKPVRKVKHQNGNVATQVLLDRNSFT